MPRTGFSSWAFTPATILPRLVVLLGAALFVLVLQACRPSTVQVGGKGPAVAGSTAGEAGVDALRTGGSGGGADGPHEQAAPVTSGVSGLVGCGTDGAAGAASAPVGHDAAAPKMIRDAYADVADKGGNTPEGGAGGDIPPNVTSDGGRASDPEPAAAPGAGQLAIVELLINPAGTDTGREWIEIVNRSDHPLSLVNLHVADTANDATVDFAPGGDVKAGASGAAMAYPPQLGAGARAVLIQSGDPTKNGGVTWQADAVVGTFGTLVSLNNEGDTISVCAGDCATGLVLARVSWDSSLGAGYDGHALVIDDLAHRCPATAPFGDAGSFGTPFAANPVCP